MNLDMKFMARLGLVMAALAFPMQAFAFLTAISVSPSDRNVPLGTGGVMQVKWTVTFNDISPNTVTSTHGLFRGGGIGGPVLGTINRVFTAPVAGSVGPEILNFSEVVRIPADIMLR